MPVFGPADIEAIKQSDLIINEILTKLKTEVKINPNYKADFRKLDKLLRYSDDCTLSLGRFEAAITKDSYTSLDVLKNDLAKHAITEKQILVIYGALIFNQILLLYAHLANILLCLLTNARYKDHKNKQREITGKESLGTLIEIIKRLTGVDLSKIIDNEFRNAVAHGWYHFENGDTLVYFTDGTLVNKKSMSLGELYIKQRKLGHFVARWSWRVHNGV